MKKVTVYFFQKYDIMTDQNVRSKRPATVEAIASVRGQPIMETALDIDETELDGDGFRKRGSVAGSTQVVLNMNLLSGEPPAIVDWVAREGRLPSPEERARLLEGK